MTKDTYAMTPKERADWIRQMLYPEGERMIPRGAILLTEDEALKIRNNYAGASRICHAKSPHVSRAPGTPWDECTDPDCVRDRENLALLGGGS